jgi:hypothetical protein
MTEDKKAGAIRRCEETIKFLEDLLNSKDPRNLNIDRDMILQDIEDEKRTLEELKND